MNMYVSNLGFSVTDESLRNLFVPFGEVTSAKVIMDKITGRSRGFGFVEMPSDDNSKKAIQALHGKEIEGRSISVSEARKREERPGRNSW